MHKHGKGTPPYFETIERVDARLALLWQLLEERGGGRLILVSDHGMAAVTRYVTFEIEKSVTGVGSRFGYLRIGRSAGTNCRSIPDSIGSTRKGTSIKSTTPSALALQDRLA
jgi:hypothetical protein